MVDGDSRDERSFRSKKDAEFGTNTVRSFACRENGSVRRHDGIWMFTCLWRACVAHSSKEDAPALLTGMKLNVPDIVLFEDGLPRFWLCTHKGKLTRRDLYGTLIDPSQRNVSQSPPRKTTVEECMRHTAEGMHRFWQQTDKKPNIQWALTPMCVVRIPYTKSAVVYTTYLHKYLK